MTNLNDEKSEQELTCRFKMDIRNLTCELEGLKNLHFNGLLLTKVYNVWAKTLQRNYMTLACDAKVQEMLTCGFENDMRNLADFHQSTWNSQNWDFSLDPFYTK